jgi:segregation and condensation protein B
MATSDKLSTQIEAVLAAQSEPMAVSDLQDITEASPEDIQKAIAELKNALDNRGLSLIHHENHVQLVTDPGESEIVAKQKQKEVDTNLTKAQSEALAVIAYMAPVSKSVIDFIRGVNSRAVIRNLATRGLINKDRSGEQVTFSVSTEALQHIGVTNAHGLPKYQDTRERLAEFVETNENND